MAFVRWYLTPVLVGFGCGLMVNPVVAAVGFMIWIVLIGYILRRWAGSPEH